MRAWLEIDLDRLIDNYEVVRAKIGAQVGLIAVVKSDAYGHGIERVTKVLDQCGVDMFAVMTLEEAFRVKSNSRKPVLIMGYLDSKEIGEAVEQGFVLSLFDKELAPLIERSAARIHKKVKVHLKVETGLNRLGMITQDAVDFLISQRHFPHIEVESVFSHLSSASNYQSNIVQLRKLQEIILLTQDKAEVLPFHLVSSYALGNFAEGYLDAVRVGLAFYGVDDVLPGLQPTLTFKSFVAQVKSIGKGDGVSYDHLFVAERNTDIAVVAAGYGEGFTQALTGHAQALIGGVLVPIIGKIAMNLCVADVTGLPVKRGDEVVLIGSQKNENGKIETIRVAELAQKASLRHHEIITRLGSALPRVYYGG